MFNKLWKRFIEIQYKYWFKDDLESLEQEIKMLNEKIDLLKKAMKGEDISYEPEKLGEIKILELRNLLYPYCKDIHLSDTIYGLTSVEEAKRFSIATKIECRKWLREQHDCDEFSFALMGYWNDGLKQFAFGIAWSDLHAFNIMVDDKKQVWIIEPQENKFIKIEDAKSPYKLLKVIMI